MDSVGDITKFWHWARETSGYPPSAHEPREWLRAAVLLGLLVIYLLGTQFFEGRQTEVLVIPNSDFVVAGGEGATDFLTILSAADGPVTLRAALDIPAELRARPLALYVSGLFSAEVTWDGQPLGAKGRPGARADEIPGPIDAAFHVPSELLAGPSHELTLRLSATRNIYRPSVLSHGIYLGPYRSDARRPVTFYLPALMLGGLMAGLGLLQLLGQNRTRWFYAGAALALLVALGAEASRVVFDYPYDWHPVRLGLVAAGLAGFSALIFVGEWPAKQRYLVLGALLSANVAAVLLITGFDDKAAAISLTGFVAIAIAISMRVGPLHPRGVVVNVVALLAILTERLDQIAYLDSAVYMLGVLLIAATIEPHRILNPATKSLDGRFRVRGPVTDKYMPVAHIAMITSEGDGVMVHVAGTEPLYHSERLGRVADIVPNSFMRIHRSAIVNLEHVTQLRSEPGSKYYAKLRTGDEIRIARSSVADLRARLVRTEEQS